MDRVRVFSCFDPRHDEDLHARLVRNSEDLDSPIAVVDRSRAEPAAEGWEADLRSRLASVDLVLVMCGEHTGSAMGVCAELRIAQEQDKPYLLVRGRRDVDWTPPLSARSDDPVYTWDWRTLLSRIGVTLRGRQVPS